MAHDVEDVFPQARLEDCDRGILESALASPRASFAGMEMYAGLPSKAAVLTYALAKSQACVDGNKRIAFILLNEFLAINGAVLEMSDDAAVAMLLKAAESEAQLRDQVILELTHTLEPAIAAMKEEDSQ